MRKFNYSSNINNSTTNEICRIFLIEAHIVIQNESNNGDITRKLEILQLKLQNHSEKCEYIKRTYFILSKKTNLKAERKIHSNR